jgi:NADPH:quinone reductase-like Zn-dependent oxidoreductase
MIGPIIPSKGQFSRRPQARERSIHAIVLSEFGSAANLRPGEVRGPDPEPGWVTVQLCASALNWHDILVREGRYNSPLPHILGADGAGVRTDTGDEVMIVPSLFWGDRPYAPGPQWEILGDRIPGTYAELVSVPESCLAPKPANWAWEEAAAFPLVGLTCFRALVTRGRLQAGESLLVLGAGGGVATTAVMLGCALGATVCVTSSSASKIANAKALGASEGILYLDASWPEAARALSPGGHGFDLVIDAVGTWVDAIRTLRPGGRLVVLGATSAETAMLAIRPFYFGQFDLLGTTMGSHEDFAGLLQLVQAEKVSPPVIDRVFRLDEAASAHRHLESRRAFGKIVLAV